MAYRLAWPIGLLTKLEDDVINKEEELEGQYVAIKIGHKTEGIGEE